MPTVLVIGGSDSSGGAGIAQDLRVLVDCGVRATVAITAVTAQTHAGVHAIHQVPAAVLAMQISTALGSNAIRAIKIGMLGNRDAVEIVAQALPSRASMPVVLDPVHFSSSGQALLDAGGLRAVRERLLPCVTLVTPNLVEAAALSDSHPATGEDQMSLQGERIRGLGADAVLVKGGHAGGSDCVDLLVCGKSDVRRLVAPRLPGGMRGTGCALASAIASRLAIGVALPDACTFAKRYVFERLRATCDLERQLRRADMPL